MNAAKLRMKQTNKDLTVRFINNRFLIDLPFQERRLVAHLLLIKVSIYYDFAYPERICLHYMDAEICVSTVRLRQSDNY